MAIGLLEPVRAVFDPRLYAGASSRSAWRAVGYVGYLAAVAAVVTAAWFRVAILPQMDDMVAWIAPRMPSLEFTTDGMRTQVIQPYLVSASPGGQILLCVNTVDGREDTCRDASFLITKTRIVMRTSKADPLTYDLTRITDRERRMFHSMFGDGPGLRRLYLRFRSASVAVVALLVGAMFLIWKLGVAVTVGVAVILIGRLLRARLRWAGVFNVAAWAVTPAAVLEALALGGFVPPSMLRVTTSAAVTAAWVLVGIVAARGGFGLVGPRRR
jgi:hypothetical protein